MAGSTKRIDRRPDALSKERIVEAAIEILDAEGESALTFRALGARLATGSGAIYWHVANKDELLQAAVDDVVTRALGRVPAPADPREAIRAAALAVYDAIDGRPWVGSQLTREPTQAGGMLMLERFGEPLAALGVPEAAWFDCASALHNAVLGFAAQTAAGGRIAEQGGDQAGFLARVAARWTRLDPGAYPFVHRVAAQLADHDDRAQFLAGIDLVIAGIATVR